MPAKEADYRDFGFQPNVVETYRTASRKGQLEPLNIHIYQPGGGADVAVDRGLLVWFYAGGFRVGRLVHSRHRALARRLNALGITVAIPQYRLGAGRADLEDSTRARMAELETMAHPDFPNRFRRANALAALEDAAAALNWIEDARARLGLKTPIVVGGSSAGAMTGLNLIYLAPYLGMTCPPIAGVLSYSGGLAWPELGATSDVPVFAVHNPTDDRMPFTPIADLAHQRKTVTLITAPEQDHGEWRLSPEDTKTAAFGRIAEKVTEFGDDFQESSL